jgi:hypothetical protein
VYVVHAVYCILSFSIFKVLYISVPGNLKYFVHTLIVVNELERWN